MNEKEFIKELLAILEIEHKDIDNKYLYYEIISKVRACSEALETAKEMIRDTLYEIEYFSAEEIRGFEAILVNNIEKIYNDYKKV